MEQDKRTLDRALVKDRIIKYASKAFAQKGIRQVKMDVMATELAISKRTLYELIEDKESLLLEVLKYNHSKKLQMLEDVRQSANNIMEIIVAFYEYSILQLERINIKFFEDLQRTKGTIELPPCISALNEVNKLDTNRKINKMYRKLELAGLV